MFCSNTSVYTMLTNSWKSRNYLLQQRIRYLLKFAGATTRSKSGELCCNFLFSFLHQKMIRVNTIRTKKMPLITSENIIPETVYALFSTLINSASLGADFCTKENHKPLGWYQTSRLFSTLKIWLKL